MLAPLWLIALLHDRNRREAARAVGAALGEREGDEGLAAGQKDAAAPPPVAVLEDIVVKRRRSFAGDGFDHVWPASPPPSSISQVQQKIRSNFGGTR